MLSEFFTDNIESVVGNVIQCLGNEIAQPMTIGYRGEIARNGDYYEDTVPRYNMDLFREHFRMSRQTFEDLVNLVGYEMAGKSDYLADVRKKIMFTVWILAKPESFLAAGDRFAFAKSTAYEIFKEMVKVISGMLSSHIKFPNRGQCNQEAIIFQMRSRGFPGVFGAIDGCHIPIKAPVNKPVDFYNRNKIHSIILQGTCDHKCRFIDVFIGMPGRMHDARVFRNSELFGKLNHPTSPLLPPNLHIIGDSAFPLLQNLLTPYRDNSQLTSRQIIYNQKLSCCRSIIERAFGLLKGKFRRLKYFDIKTPSFGNEIIAACCVLHNFLINKEAVHFMVDEHEENEEDDNDLVEVVADEIPAISKRDTICSILL